MPATRSCSWPPRSPPTGTGRRNLALEYGDAALAAEHALSAPRPYSLDLTATRSVLAGYIATSSGAFDEAAAAYIDAIDRYRRTNSMGHAANFLGGAAAVLCLGGRFDDAVPFATEGLALARANGAPSSVTGNLVALAQALSQREPERARVLLEDAAHEFSNVPSANWNSRLSTTSAKSPNSFRYSKPATVTGFAAERLLPSKLFPSLFLVLPSRCFALKPPKGFRVGLNTDPVPDQVQYAAAPPRLVIKPCVLLEVDL